MNSKSVINASAKNDNNEYSVSMLFYMLSLLVIEVLFKKKINEMKYFKESHVIWVLENASLKVGKVCSHLTFIIYFHA